MPTRNVCKKALTLLIICAITCLVFLAGHWWFPQRSAVEPRVEVKEEALAPTCRIEFLPPQERIARMNAPIVIPGQFAPSAQGIVPQHHVPLELADNPVLLWNHFAEVRFENTTGRPLVLYVVWWIGGVGYEPLMENTAIADVEVRDSTGQVLEERPDFRQSRVLPRVPRPQILRDNKHPLYVLQAGDHVNLSMSILGRCTPKPGIEPLTYTVRAIVSYAEGPSGETKRITSEPVTVTVTEDHIKAAEAYWAAGKK